MIDAEMYGMMPSANTERRLKRAAGEEVEEAEHAAAHRLEELRERDRIDARRRNVRSEAVNRQQREREEHALAEVLDRPDVADCIDDVGTLLDLLAGPAGGLDLLLGRAENLVAETESFLRACRAEHLDAVVLSP
jgi:hypothetical protein